jgi:predicted MPP superfamily phosphohydrolase
MKANRLFSLLLVWLGSLVEQCLGCSFSFLSVGDWGASAVSEQDSYNVYTVAEAMSTISQETSPAFVIGLGDNFYWCGIQNVSDSQVTTDWLEPFAFGNPLPWYQTLGNHDYGYNATAQLDLPAKYPQWIMDDRYYVKRLSLNVTMIFLDTSPCIADYRNSNPAYWDPCGTEYPTCSLSSSANDDFEGICQFHQNILDQNCTDQFNWFQSVLSQVPEDDWLIVVGHHPIDEVNVEDFTSALQKHGFSLYLNGHQHTLNQYTVDSGGAYVTSGAGSLVNVPKSSTRLLNGDKNELGHSYSVKWSKTVAGFTQHIWNADYTLLTTNYVDYTGAIIHSFIVNRNGAIQ